VDAVDFPSHIAEFAVNFNKDPSCRWDSRPYCLTADYQI